METKSNNRKAWVTSAVVLTALVAVVYRRQQRRYRLARQTAADATHAELTKALKECPLPVLVRAEDLPTGWGVAPPVFYPPHCAAIPLVLPSDMQESERHGRRLRAASPARSERSSADDSALAPSAFLFCSHTGRTASPFASPRDEQEFLAEVIAHHPVLQERLVGRSGTWCPLPGAVARVGHEGGFSRTFTHVLTSDECSVLAGVNGPYVVVAVLSGFSGAWPSPPSATKASATKTKPSGVSTDESARRRTGSATPAAAAEGEMELATAVEGIARATVSVPLSSLHGGSAGLSARVPGASFAAHQGYYRVVCACEGKELDLCIPSEWTVRSAGTTTSLPVRGGSPAVARAESSASAATAETLVTLSFTPSAFMLEGPVEVRITPGVFAALAADPEAAAATLWAASGAADAANPVAKATLNTMTGRLLPATPHAQISAVTTVYVQPKLGVLFSVHPRSAVVYEPWMTDLPTIIYYPRGDDASGEAEPPRMTIEYVVELPNTWEALASDDEEFVHNVLFHFTNWEAAAVSTTLTEISGIRCAMFHETREGRRCRTYVLPRAATVLVIRWETSVGDWEKELPLFQQILDTLHVNAVAVTR
ncbi:hypothetical protein NESM_000191200 [Novymonas esmeraldas]|uniref:Uncharacterized protein n=1 Tax=Novymonas esmeraldas TaxID=1808958 RepID=A0AAW0F4W6_9TRYP